MPKKAFSINFPVERVILSDVLPYEIPIIFSNRNYYRFLINNSVKFSDMEISWSKKDDSFDRLIKMMFGIDLSHLVQHEMRDGKQISKMRLEKKDLQSVPYLFSITHKQDQLRQLSLTHPKGQLMAVNFYDDFKELMIYYSSRSDISLRAPTRIAGCTYIESRTQIEQREKSDSIVEVEGENYENLKSFFVYEKFSNVFKFYESEEHLRAERDFKSLTKFDVASCFDSIYTHSIAWAIYGKEYSKKNLKSILGSFPSKFDSLMQSINYNETNGIVIGPELSRIFAEIILQSIDLDLKRRLNDIGYISGKDYVVYRYVDDYFVFHDDDAVCRNVKLKLQESLKSFKLSLNKGKEITFFRPIITPISIAKKRISDLLEDTIVCNLIPDDGDPEAFPKGRIYIGQSSLITEFKSILATSGITYDEILNYSLAIVERKTLQLMDSYAACEKSDNFDKQFAKSIDSMLGFVFFIYGVSPKVNTTIKLCRICQTVITFFKKNKIGRKYASLISQVIYERCRGVMEKTSSNKGAKIEAMYLLVLMQQLGRNYRLPEIVIAEYFGFQFCDDTYNQNGSVDYFSAITILFYIKNKVRYSRLKSSLERSILNRFTLEKSSLRGNSEMLHLALDLLACPFVAVNVKLAILDCYGIPASDFVGVHESAQLWFTKWNGFDLSRELDAKVSQEVY